MRLTVLIYLLFHIWIVSSAKSSVFVKSDTVRFSKYILSSNNTELDSSTRFNSAFEALKHAQTYESDFLLASANKNLGLLYKSFGAYALAANNLKVAIDLYEQTNYRKEQANVLFELGTVYYYLVDYSLALQFRQESLRISEQLADTFDIVDGLQGVAVMNWRLGYLKIAEQGYQRSLKLSKKIQDTASITAAYNSLGAINWGYGKFTTALEHYEKVLNFNVLTNNRKRYSIILNNIGLIYKELGDYEKAFESYSEGLKVAKEQNYTLSLAYTYNNMGEVFLLKEDYENALLNFDSALVYREQILGESGVTIGYRNLGEAYFGLKNYAQAVLYFERSVDAADQIDSKYHLANALHSLAKAYLFQQKNTKSYLLAKRSLALSIEQDYKNIAKQAYFLLSEIEELKGNSTKSLLYFKNASALKDSIFNEQSSKQVAEMQTRYETDRKERENVVLRREEQIKDMQIKVSKNQIHTQYTIIIGFGLLLIFFILFSFLLHSSRRKIIASKTLLTQQNNTINKQKTKLVLRGENLTEINELLKDKTNELEQTIGALKKATAFKNKIIAVIGHDLRGPIATIGSIMTLVTGNETDNKTKQELLLASKDTAEAALNLLENLLIWAKNEQGITAYKPALIQLANAVDCNMNLLSETAAKKEIVLVNAIDKDVMGFVDSNMFNTVVRNLLSNAIKFTEKSGKVKTVASNTGSMLQVSVIDNGTGMSNEELQKVLNSDMHYSQHGTMGEKGSGIGLQLCFDFIKQNKGSYTIQSKENEGTTFTFTIPKS